MILRYNYLSRYKTVFRIMTGLNLNEFDALLDDILPRFTEAEVKRLSRAGRQRDIGGGPDFELTPSN